MLQKIFTTTIMLILGILGMITPQERIQNDSAKENMILFDNAAVSVDVESLDLTSEWISSELFYDGYKTEEIEYRKKDYPGSYLAIRYSDCNIVRVYFFASDFDQAVPISVYGLSWGATEDDIIEILGEPEYDLSQDGTRKLRYKEKENNISVTFFINNKGLYAVDIWKM